MPRRRATVASGASSGCTQAQPDRLPTRANPVLAQLIERNWILGRHRLPPVRSPATGLSRVSSTSCRRVGAARRLHADRRPRRTDLGAGGRTLLRGDRALRARGAARPAWRWRSRTPPPSMPTSTSPTRCATRSRWRRWPGVGVCIDLFHCWAEAGLARPHRTRLAADRPDPAERLRARRPRTARPRGPGRRRHSDRSRSSADTRGWLYHGFDLELIGPRIDAEGRIRRGAARLRNRYRRCWKDFGA